MEIYDVKRLQREGRNINLPFCLALEGSSDRLSCKELLRVVPGRRAVCLGTWGGKPVIAKLFYRPLQINRHLRREAGGMRALSKAGIPSPDLLYTGKAVNTKIGVILLEYLHPAKNINEILNDIHAKDKKLVFFRKLVLILAKMHQTGLRQRDLHLKNFMMNDNIIYSIDGSSIEKNIKGRSLKVGASINNLALLFVQLISHDPSLEVDKLYYYDYSNTRGWDVSPKIFQKLQGRIDYWEKQGSKRYLKKIFRESSDFILCKSFTKYVMCKRSHHTSNMESFLCNPDQILGEHQTLMLKKGNTTTVAKITMDNRNFVVKRYNIKGFWHGLRRCFMKTRAAHSWQNAHHLLTLGIKTPMPIALLEKRLGPFKKTAYFISEYVEAPHLWDFFKCSDDRQKLAIVHMIADIFRKFKLAKICYGDMKASNIIVHQQKPFMVDLDAMRVYENRWRFISAHKKDIKRFLKNWVDFPDTKNLFKEIVSQAK